MIKIDYKKELKELYKPSAKKAAFVDVPQMNYLMIDGKGDPVKEESYHQAIEALFAVSYTIKFMIKKGNNPIDYGVLPLEGLWWAEDMSTFTVSEDKDSWLWTAMMMQPKEVTQTHFKEMVEALNGKDPVPPSVDKLRLESYDEGVSVQILYFGPYADEGPTIQMMHEYAFEEGYKLRGKHHEIYLGDPRRTAPEKLKTVLRFKVK